MYGAAKRPRGELSEIRRYASRMSRMCDQLTDSVRAWTRVREARCVPGGARGPFEDHGEGDPDVLAGRMGTKASMCAPSRIENRASRIASLASQVGQVRFAPRIPRSLVLSALEITGSVLRARDGDSRQPIRDNLFATSYNHLHRGRCH